MNECVINVTIVILLNNNSVTNIKTFFSLNRKKNYRFETAKSVRKCKTRVSKIKKFIKLYFIDRKYIQLQTFITYFPFILTMK